MKKVINDPKDVVMEMLEGMLAAFPERIRIVYENKAIIRKDAPIKGKVALVSGGGSGHEPAQGGYVGPGMLDACVAGAVFTSPAMADIADAMRMIDGGAGIFQIVTNYSGDIMNFEMAAEMLKDEGLQVESVVVDDDVAVRDSLYTSGRRGVAGVIFVHKIAGAAAEAGADLGHVKDAAQTVRDNLRSMGFALTSCTVPEVGKPTFTLAENEIEIGIGVHGEPGVERTAIKPADDITNILLDSILADLPFRSGDETAVLINGMGGTPLMELMVINRRVNARLKKEGISVYKTWVGNFMTSLEMAGASVSLLKLNDKMKAYLDAPAVAPAWPSY